MNTQGSSNNNPPRPPRHSAPWHRPFKRAFHPIAFAIIVVVIAAIVPLAFLRMLDEHVAFLTFYPAVVLAALYGGVYAGLLATAFSAVLSTYFFKPMHSMDWLNITIFFLSCTTITLVIEALHRARTRAREAELEAKTATERQRVEDVLRESEERFRTAFESNSVAMTMTALDGTLQKVNTAFCRMLGYEEHELIGRSFVDFTHSDDLPENIPEMQRLFKGELSSLRMEKRYVRKDGTLAWGDMSTSHVRDSRNRPLYFVTLIQDITQRKQAEEALRESEERYRALIKASAQVLYSMNPDWSEMRQLQGGNFIVDTEKPNPGWLQEYIHPDDQKLVLEVIEKAVKAGTVFELEHRVWRVDGTVGWTFSRAIPVRDATGEIVEWFGAANDITERKRAEQELQRAKDELEVRVQERTRELGSALESLRAETETRIRMLEELREKEHLLIQQNRLSAMGEMIGNIAHQWRQPLNVLGLTVQQLPFLHQMGLLTEAELNKQVAEAMKLIEHMSGTIDDFRNFFKPDKERVEFTLVSVVTSTIKLIEPAFVSKQIRIAIINHADPVVYGYPNEYSQVILNVLNNAKDALEDGKTKNPCITVTISLVDDDSVLTIRDNAGGIPPDVIGKIFDPHFTTKGPQGTGIGLFMAKNIIERSMHGSMRVHNITDGAEFIIKVKAVPGSSQ